jgi:hypothetical protein
MTPFTMSNVEENASLTRPTAGASQVARSRIIPALPKILPPIPGARRPKELAESKVSTVRPSAHRFESAPAQHFGASLGSTSTIVYAKPGVGKESTSKPSSVPTRPKRLTPAALIAPAVTASVVTTHASVEASHHHLEHNETVAAACIQCPVFISPASPASKSTPPPGAPFPVPARVIIPVLPLVFPQKIILPLRLPQTMESQTVAETHVQHGRTAPAMPASEKQYPSRPPSPFGTNEYHEYFMRQAIDMVCRLCAIKQWIANWCQAELALETDETPVGCVFVRNGEVIGRGMNDTNKSLNVGIFPIHQDTHG